MSTHSAISVSAITFASRPALAEALPTRRQLQLMSVMDGAFRANPGYELLAFDHLPPEERELFSALQDDPSLYGVLRPREGTGLPVKSACLLTSQLFTALKHPSALPGFITAGSDPEINLQIVQLVLDGVLQILHRGELLYGPRAFSAVCKSAPLPRPAGVIARLSHDALRYAQALPLTDPAALSARLYAWGRIPSSPSWRRKFPTADSVPQCLRIEDGAPNALRLSAHWKSLPPDPDNDGWLFWQSLRPRFTGPGAPPMAAYKLYVSPHPAFLREAFEAMIPALEHTHASAFKIGRNLAGILRPDKMIAYFPNLDQALEAADRILARLQGCPAHGVPFTAQIGNPLLSWGADPPRERNVPSWLERQSWRFWIANRLAVSMATAKAQSSGAHSLPMEPWKFAIDRLSLDGVDTDTWSPIRKEDN